MSAGAWPQAGYVSEPNEMCLGLCNPSLLHHNGNIHFFKKKKKFCSPFHINAYSQEYRIS